ncbi:MAG: hypothetical protein HQK77_21655, partial [Desulfobacterales bacterium]|nr:hypothetical protein [Desulfobacterales bacterium]
MGENLFCPNCLTENALSITGESEKYFGRDSKYYTISFSVVNGTVVCHRELDYEEYYPELEDRHVGENFYLVCSCALCGLNSETYKDPEHITYIFQNGYEIFVYGIHINFLANRDTYTRWLHGDLQNPKTSECYWKFSDSYMGYWGFKKRKIEAEFNKKY